MDQIIEGNILNLETGRVINNQEIHVIDGKITAICSSKRSTQEYLLPGLIDTHVHLVLEPSPKLPAFDPKESISLRTGRVYKNLRSSLEAGITTVRDCGYPSDEIFEIKREMELCPNKGSKIVLCGQAITTPQGHAKDLGVEVRGSAKMKEVCEHLVSLGADFIKLVNNDPEGFSVEEVRIAIGVAHRHGLKVSCHLYQRAVLRRAIEAGVDTIEHFSDADQEDIKQILKKGIIVSPTYVSAFDATAYPESNVIGEEEMINKIEEGGFEEWIPKLESGVRLLIKNRAPLATGSDGGFLHTDFRTILREISGLIKLGATPLVALQSATINGAKVLGKENLLGSLEIGKIADVVVYEENPLENLDTILSPKRIYRQGVQVV